MFSRRSLSTLTLLIAATLLAACNAPTAPTNSASSVMTQAAGTAIFRLTESAALTPSPTITATLAPTETPPPPTPTVEASPTLAQPTATLAAAATATTAPVTTADAAGYVADVDYPDGTAVKPGETFTKTWRIKNTGANTWTTSYSLVCIDFGKFKSPETVNLPNEVKPGETIDLKVTLTAPDATGSHKAFFRMRNAAGQFFRLDGGGDLWVQVNVGQPAATATPGGSTPTITLTPDASTATSTPEPSLTPTTQ